MRSAAVEESGLEVIDGYLVYEVEVVLGEEKFELELLVDAGDGRILAVHSDDDHDDDDADDDEKR